MSRKAIRVIERKLGREKALGLAYHDDGEIHIEPGQEPQTFLWTLLHELLHIAYPDLTERQIRKGERILGETLWAMRYRRTSQ